MGEFIYQVMKVYVGAALNFYFNGIKIHGKENLKGKGPFLFVANHQNAFMDGLLMVCTNSFPVHFLIRADIFKTKFARTMLKLLKLMPVYRIRDGFSSLSKNQEQFDECIRLFRMKDSVLIFPEGNHGDTRRLRPLSKGFTRIVFEAYRQHPEMDLQVVPVGINYADHKAFNKKISIHYGPAIPFREYCQEPQPQLANAFKDKVAEEIEKLVAHIDESRYEEILTKLKATNPDFSDPDDTNARIKKLMNGEVIEPTQRSSVFYTITTPLRPFAWFINLPLILGWKKFSKRIKDPVFTTSMKFGYGIFVAQIYYIVLMSISTIWFGWWGLLSYPALLISLKMLRKTY